MEFLSDPAGGNITAEVGGPRHFLRSLPDNPDLIHTPDQQRPAKDHVDRVEEAFRYQQTGIKDLLSLGRRRRQQVSLPVLVFTEWFCQEIFPAPARLKTVNEGLALRGRAIEIDRGNEKKPIRSIHLFVEWVHIVPDYADGGFFAAATNLTGPDFQFIEMDIFYGIGMLLLQLLHYRAGQYFTVAVSAGTAQDNKNIHIVLRFKKITAKIRENGGRVHAPGPSCNDRQL